MNTGLAFPTVITRECLNLLKRDILFYDRIRLIGAANEIKSTLEHPFTKIRYQENADEMEYLFSTPYFEDCKDEVRLIDKSDGIPEKYTNYYNMGVQLVAASEEINRLNQSMDKDFSISSKDPSSNMDAFTKLEEERVQQVRIFRGFKVRLMSEYFSESEGGQCSPICPLEDYSYLNLNNLHSTDVLSLAMNRVPLPPEDTHWEIILEMKQDEDLRDRARKLRLWCQEVSAGGYDSKTIEELVEDRLSDYRKYMDLHLDAFLFGRLESMIVAGSEVLEEVVKLQFGKLAKHAFSIGKQRRALALAEIGAPGRELSIISKVSNQFSNIT